MTSIRVSQFVNSFVDRPGNIGIRTGRILRSLDGPGACICRGSQGHLPGIEYHEMGILGHFPRLLNGFRIYLAPKFDHRRWDIAFFERFSIHHLQDLSLLPGVAHVWDLCPRLIERLQQEGVPVVLDMPIGPTSYGERLYREGRVDFLRSPRRIQELEKEAVSAADLVIAPSAFVAEELELMGVGKERIAVVEFGVDSPLHVRQAQVGSGDKKGLDFCLVGNVNRRKGVSELLTAWADTAFTHDRLHLCGRVNPDISSDLSKDRVGNVLTPGFVHSFDYLQNCDVFVLPSWLEGSAKAVYEAMACGLPAIVTHSAGSVVRDGIDGFIIEAGDVQALRERMLWFKEHPDQIKVMGKAARIRAREYTWERYAHRVIQQYQKLIS